MLKHREHHFTDPWAMSSKHVVCPHCSQGVRLKLTIHAIQVDDNRPVSAPTD
ncbi:hypothetical protein QUF64_01595 [Anaerolineales bacterium HSG6]|nr:hypothetical protein [Anaerolineales bacterium HSG6]